MQPYVIRQGDFLLKVANKFGFDADAIWQHPNNADLRQLRSDPNILLATDMLYIPDQLSSAPATCDLAVGQTNTFVATDAPKVALNLRFVHGDGTPYASVAYTVEELAELTGLTTDGDGVATFQVPVTLATATVTFSDTGDSFPLSIGELDPIDTPSGVFSRLQNLGHIGRDVEFDPSNLDVLRVGLLVLKASQPPSDDAATDSATATDADQDSATASDAGQDSATASDAEPDPAGGGDDASDDAGLADDGTLDASTKSLLLKAHGC